MAVSCQTLAKRKGIHRMVEYEGINLQSSCRRGKNIISHIPQFVKFNNNNELCIL